MNDLLADRKGAIAPENKDKDVEAGHSGTPPGTVISCYPGLTLGFVQVNQIKNAMVEIRTMFLLLQRSNEESKTATKAATMKAIKERMETQIDSISKLAQGVKAKVETLDKAVICPFPSDLCQSLLINIVNQKIKGCHEGSSTDRTRMAITMTLKKKLRDLMVDFQDLRQMFQDEYREIVERRVFTVTGQKVDDSVIDNLIETGHGEQIFQRAIQEQGRGHILDIIAEIQERHDAVRDIEKKLLDLHQIFLDMAVLVEAQGELLDNIESQAATEHITAGTTALVKSKKLQRKTRKCMCLAIILLLVTATIIVLVVVQPWKKKS
ncbi:hypothetical protein CY35_05G045100 [Sphagnum magellanicum]|nr:hypothetical protein CY35_05G045100 [Sphagnum magellanicum]